MYSEKIRPKVEVMFNELRQKVKTIVAESYGSKDAVSSATSLISSELTIRSKTILSDMLFELSDSLMKTEFFSDVARQNRFFESNLRHEILSKYKFDTTVSVDYREASRMIHSLEFGGSVLVGGGLIEVGTVLAAGLPLSRLVPIPVGVLIIASIGAAVADYYLIEPKRNRKTLAKALDNYLAQTQEQFLTWFDEVEKYFNRRVEEIKQAM